MAAYRRVYDSRHLQATFTFSIQLHVQTRSAIYTTRTARLWCTTPEIAVGYRTPHGAVACLVCADNKAGLTDVISGGHRAVTSLCALT